MLQGLPALAARVRLAIKRAELALSDRNREEAALAEARKRDADEVGRRADARKLEREREAGRE